MRFAAELVHDGGQHLREVATFKEISNREYIVFHLKFIPYGTKDLSGKFRIWGGRGAGRGGGGDWKSTFRIFLRIVILFSV